MPGLRICIYCGIVSRSSISKKFGSGSRSLILGLRMLNFAENYVRSSLILKNLSFLTLKKCEQFCKFWRCCVRSWSVFGVQTWILNTQIRILIQNTDPIHPNLLTEKKCERFCKFWRCFKIRADISWSVFGRPLDPTPRSGSLFSIQIRFIRILIQQLKTCIQTSTPGKMLSF